MWVSYSDGILLDGKTFWFPWNKFPQTISNSDLNWNWKIEQHTELRDSIKSQSVILRNPKGRLRLAGVNEALTELEVKPFLGNWQRAWVTSVRFNEIDTTNPNFQWSYTILQNTNWVMGEEIDQNTSEVHYDNSGENITARLIQPDQFTLEEIELVMNWTVTAINRSLSGMEGSEHCNIMISVLNQLEEYNELALQVLRETTHKES